MFNLLRKHKIACLVVFFDLILILGVVLAIVMHQTKTATIDFMVAPTAVEITVNGKKVERTDSLNVAPGDYHVVISMEGMQTKEVDFSLKDDEYHVVKEYLKNEDGSFLYYVEHPDEIAVLKPIADGEANKFINDYTKLSSITEKLPLTFSNTYDNETDEIISISIKWGEGSECEKNSYCLIITDFTGKNREKALSMISEAGYNPDDYELVFKKGMAE